MDDFQKQLKNNQENIIAEFNNRTNLEAARNLYKENFASIKRFIAQTNPRSAIEDIIGLDNRLNDLLMNEHLLFQEINRAINQGNLTLEDIK